MNAGAAAIRRSVVRGTGHYLPERVVENDFFAQTLDTSDEWIRSRTGIERRHFAAEDQRTSDLAIAAARAALDDAGMEADQIDAIVLATSTPDFTFPSVATMVQAGLGMTRGFAFDVQAVCAGFVFALANADGLIRSGQADRVLVMQAGRLVADATPAQLLRGEGGETAQALVAVPRDQAERLREMAR